MSKDAFIEAHEALIAEYMAEWEETHPHATAAEWQQAEQFAYDHLADGAYDRMRENLADRADYLRQIRKEGM